MVIETVIGIFATIVSITVYCCLWLSVKRKYAGGLKHPRLPLNATNASSG